MKRIGYPPHFAGAVEAVASTGGQFMPPVMGAGAFIMADFLGMPYTRIALLAFIPACLYYFGCYMQIHFRAKKLGMVGVPRAQLPSLWGVLRRKGHLLIPVATLVYFLLNNYSTTKVAFLAIMATIIVGFLQRGEDRFTLRSLYEALETGARTALGVAVATACAGIIVGVITMTGLGLKFSVLIIDISQGIPLLTMVLAAVACLIMGLGVPVTASYIIVATIVAPAMVKIGILPIAAHLFVFYFAVLADITPPECIAAFVAAGIAGANPMKTGVTAFRLGIAAFIVPFIFCFDSSLLGLGTVPEVAYRILVSIAGVIALAAVGELYLMRRSRWYETAMLGGAAAFLLLPGWIDDLIGAALLGAVIFMQYLRNRKEASLSPALGS
jgi:TRAP transporter 4TM/12TM fusion protein